MTQQSEQLKSYTAVVEVAGTTIEYRVILYNHRVHINPVSYMYRRELVIEWATKLVSSITLLTTNLWGTDRCSTNALDKL